MSSAQPIRRQANYQVSELDRGVVYGLVFQVPASLLVATYDGGIARVGNPSFPDIQDTGFQPAKSTVAPIEKIVASGTVTVTASKDSYIYLDSAGVVQKVEVAQNAAKPKIPDGNGEFLAKVVNDGTNITGITDLRRLAAYGGFVSWAGILSFESGETGVVYIPVPATCRLITMTASVVKALAGTDTGTVTAAIGVNDVYTNVTGGVITGGISAALSTRYSVVPTAANQAIAGNYVRLTPAKTTAGGRLSVQLVFLQDS